MSETLSQKARIRLQQPLLSFSWSESPCFKQVLIRQKPPSLWVHPTIQVHFQWGRNFRSTTQSFNLLWTERSANIRNQNRICPKKKKKRECLIQLIVHVNQPNCAFLSDTRYCFSRGNERVIEKSARE